MPEDRLRMVIGGVVQGVFFRASTSEKAVGLGLTGWVRNLPTGEVECVAEGNKEALGHLLAWARRGPPGSVVESVRESWEQATGEFKDFRITW